MEDAMDTNRREVLRWVGSGVAIAFAGCSGASSASNQNAAGRNTTPRTTHGETKQSANGNSGPAALLASDFKRVHLSIPPDNVVWGKLKNTGNRHITTLEVEATFRDRAGRVLTTTTASIDGLEPGGVWEASLQSYGTPRKVATGTLAVKTVTTGPPPEKPDTAAVLPESLRPLHESEPPTAEGEVKNIGQTTFDHLTALARFYAENDSLLATGSADIAAFEPGETREFTIEFPGYELAGARATSYDVSLGE